MLRKTVASVAALGAFVILAFGSGGDTSTDLGALDELGSDSTTTDATAANSGGGSGNEAACRAWIEHQNDLPCMSSATMDADKMCGMVGMSSKDMTAYYNCMKDNAKCNGNIPELSGQSECASLQ